MKKIIIYVLMLVMTVNMYVHSFAYQLLTQPENKTWWNAVVAAGDTALLWVMILGFAAILIVESEKEHD